MRQVDRRAFLKWGLIASSAAVFSGCGLSHYLPFAGGSSSLQKEAMFYEKLGGDTVRCRTCYHNCEIPPGGRGLCRTRENRDNVLYSVVYGLPSAVMVDPVEKEPQYHFLPGTNILCIGTTGCNFSCKFCHNWQLSQQTLEELERHYEHSPQEIVEMAEERKTPSISFTYNEPTVFYEYMYDISRLAKEKDINVIFHSNGFMNKDPLKRLLPYVDSVTVDLKGFREELYREVCGGSLEPVLDNLAAIRESGVWLEIVNLVVPGLNDDEEEIKKMCSWIKNNLGDGTPLHFSRFFPSYKLADLSPTPVEILEMARVCAVEEGLKYVTLGNVPGHEYNSTFCPGCGEIIVERHHFAVKDINIEEGKCRFCQEEIPGIWA